MADQPEVPSPPPVPNRVGDPDAPPRYQRPATSGLKTTLTRQFMKDNPHASINQIRSATGASKALVGQIRAAERFAAENQGQAISPSFTRPGANARFSPGVGQLDIDALLERVQGGDAQRLNPGQQAALLSAIAQQPGIADMARIAALNSLRALEAQMGQQVELGPGKPMSFLLAVNRLSKLMIAAGPKVVQASLTAFEESQHEAASAAQEAAASVEEQGAGVAPADGSIVV